MFVAFYRMSAVLNRDWGKCVDRNLCAVCVITC